MDIAPNTPVLIGVGQSGDRIDAADYHGWSAADLAAEAARAALADAGAVRDIASRIGAIATTRTFEASRNQSAPFGQSSNFPRSVAQRLGISPATAIWEKAGGNSPQDLVTEFAGRIAAGEFEAVLIAGAEAISTVRHAQRTGLTLDFAEHPAGDVEDRGPGLDAWQDPLAQRHGVVSPTLAYALAETARRARLGMTRTEYAEAMGRLFAPFTGVAHTNPYTAWEAPAYSAEELVAPGPHNRWIADPYPLRLVARDQVNLGAAVLLASARTAAERGVPDKQMVFLNGHARATEKKLLARPDLGDAPAARAACDLALRRAAITADEIAAFDFYSCYPIAVSNVALDGLGLAPEDPRGLTLTGGLPFFGGPGNNYSMHAIAEAVATARRARGSAVLVGANGGYLSKYSVGIYSTTPRSCPEDDGGDIQSQLDSVADIVPLPTYEGTALVESYTVHHGRAGPDYAVAVARTLRGERVIARSADGDADTPRHAHAEDVLAHPIAVRSVDGLNLFTFVAEGSR